MPCGFQLPGEPRSRRSLNLRLVLGGLVPHVSEELQRRAITPVAVGAPYEQVIWASPVPCQHQSSDLRTAANSRERNMDAGCLGMAIAGRHAALEPHSSVVLSMDSLESQGSPPNVATDPTRSSVIDRNTGGKASLLPPTPPLRSYTWVEHLGRVALSQPRTFGALLTFFTIAGDDDWITVGRAAPTDPERTPRQSTSATNRRFRSMVAPAA